MEDRRSFVRTLLVAATGLACFRPGPASAKKLAIPLKKASKLVKVGGWSILKIKGRSILFIRDGEKSVKAFDPECTHEKCLVAYQPDKKHILCDCHESAFDLEGKALSGPAKQPLRTYVATLSGERIILTLD
jgi:Rieske Fe-S protein